MRWFHLEAMHIERRGNCSISCIVVCKFCVVGWPERSIFSGYLSSLSYSWLTPLFVPVKNVHQPLLCVATPKVFIKHRSFGKKYQITPDTGIICITRSSYFACTLVLFQTITIYLCVFYILSFARCFTHDQSKKWRTSRFKHVQRFAWRAAREHETKVSHVYF